MKVISDYYPNWRDLSVHESSPGGRGASIKLHNECKGYTASQFYPDITPGHVHPKSGYRCESLEKLTFPRQFIRLVYNPGHDGAYLLILRRLSRKLRVY